MLRLHRAVARLVVLAGLAAGAACAGPGTSSREPAAMVPIRDVAAVAGTWGGLMTRQVGRPQQEWVELRVEPDGTYQALGARQIGALIGQGTLTVDDGRAHATGRNGTAVLTLLESDGRVLRVEFRDASGIPFSGNLRPRT